MLIYSSNLILEPNNGIQEIVDLIAKWLSEKCKRTVDPSRLAGSIRDLTLAERYHIQSRATVDENNQPIFPYYFCAQLSHSDDQVKGRRWVTEIGLRQDTPDKPISCTFLLKTDEVSARVTTPIQVTRPILVHKLAKCCNPSGDTPGLKIKYLDEESATPFLMEVEREERRYPLVLISSNRDGVYPISSEKLRSQLVGIANVVEIPPSADTYKIEVVVGRYIAFGGAINIIFQARQGDREIFCETVLYRPNDLLTLLQNGKSIESEVLATITHRTNLPYSWRHISLETVNQAIWREKFNRVIQRAKQNDDSAEYVALLEGADEELRTKDTEILELRSQLEELENHANKLQSDTDSLKSALAAQSSQVSSDELLNALVGFRNLMPTLISDNPSLEDSLNLINHIFPDRIVILDSAFNSSRESSGFRFGRKALDLLFKFSTGYWEALETGKGDMHAKNVFGKDAYAQNEGQALSVDGKKRRTFSYRDRSYEMNKHLKIGVKPSAAETLRIHFEWIADDKKLIIGHCGKHLDF